jgi:hypothetical protein
MGNSDELRIFHDRGVFALKWRNFRAQGCEISGQECDQGQEEHDEPSSDRGSDP